MKPKKLETNILETHAAHLERYIDCQLAMATAGGVNELAVLKELSGILSDLEALVAQYPEMAIHYLPLRTRIRNWVLSS